MLKLTYINGVTGVEKNRLVLVGIVATLLVATVIFYMRGQDNKTANSSKSNIPSEVAEPAAPVAADTKKYTHPELDFSVDYDKNWTLETSESTDHVQYEQVVISSPDYRTDDEGFGRLLSGASFGISCSNINRGVAGVKGQPTVEDILSGNFKTPSVYEGISEVESVDVAGSNAVTYIQAYEGQPYRVTEINFQDVSCRFRNSLNTENSKEYIQFIESITTA